VPFLVPTELRHIGLQRGKHNIYDELTFSNHDGYVFHDSGGFECGETNELEVVQNFVREKSAAKRLRDRLHAIWCSHRHFVSTVRQPNAMLGTAYQWTTNGRRWI
jgi:hypothetical protein